MPRPCSSATQWPTPTASTGSSNWRGSARRASEQLRGVRRRGNNRRRDRVLAIVQPDDTFRNQLLAVIPRLRRYARSLVFDAAAADDLVQTALERSLAHWHQFDQRRDLLVWVLSIAHNAHLDQRRRDARLSVVDPERASADQDAQGGDPGVDVGLRIDLVHALARLSPEQREPLLLVCVEQLTYAECAEVLGIPLGTVMSRVSRARASLRMFLDGSARPGAAPGLRRVI
ncbi:MAG: sigma-70 family RNA polymerase sigma factor [Ideonella sp.]|nr:sigma-70 family RNA polymerase sigma factor [Ideonella sp.]